MNKFQERLQDLLVEKNLSRLQLAKRIGITSATINGYFNRNLYPEIDIAVKIANFFECSLDYLFCLSDDDNNIDNNNLSFIETINKLLKEKEISVAKAMRDLNMSEYNYYRWRKGTKPSINALISLAKYFDTSIDYLIGYLK